MAEGKIIAITGGPRTGKSTLARLLGGELGATVFLEGEEKDFPSRILKDIQERKNVLELILWFRNKLVRDYLKALEIKKSGKMAILDVFWKTNHVYIDRWVSDDFEKGILNDAALLDEEWLPYPDLILSLGSDRETIRKFSLLGGRRYEQSESFLDEQVALNEIHESYFRNLGLENIEFVDQSKINLFDKKQWGELISNIRGHLGI